MTRPTIALCIPAFNAASFLPRLLRSAGAQNPLFDEVIVCDDASADGTSEVAARFGARVIRNQQNQGCSQSKNNALAAASSQFVHFHDADDELLPNFTRLAHSWAARADCPDVVLFAFEYRDNDSGTLLSTRHFDGSSLRFDPIDFAIREQINPFCGLYRRDRLLEVGGYDMDPTFLYNEDVAFHCKLAVRGLTFDAEPAVSIVNYRIAASMSQSNQVSCLRAHVAVMERLAVEVGMPYGKQIAGELWKAAAGLGMHGCWADVDGALDSAMRVCSNVPSSQSRRFAFLTRAIGAKRAFRVREKVLRLLRPSLRS